jgi:hypothetical protein
MLIAWSKWLARALLGRLGARGQADGPRCWRGKPRGAGTPSPKADATRTLSHCRVPRGLTSGSGAGAPEPAAPAGRTEEGGSDARSTV